jgi:hypothetical protein
VLYSASWRLCGKIKFINPTPTIVILRERQLLLRVLKLYVVVNDTHIYELNEQQPVIIENEQLPIKVTAKNGFHFSQLLTIDDNKSSVLLLGVGCQVDNGKFLGSAFLSVWLFIIFFATTNYAILVLANLPILYIMYYFFWKPKEFLKVWEVKKK